MVENTNSTTLEVQGSFALTYMVGFIPLNLRSQEMDKGVPHARARAAAAGLTMHAKFLALTNRVLQLPTYGVTRLEQS
jgi:NAD-dependent DNA ligase